MAENPVLSRSTNLESKLINFFVLFSAQFVLGVFNRSLSEKIGDFLSALASNNQFKLVKMWSGGTPHVVVITLK